MSRRLIPAIGLTRVQQAALDDENEWHAWGAGPFHPDAPLCVPRILPPAPPRPAMTWEEITAECDKIRQDYLEMKAARHTPGDGPPDPDHKGKESNHE